MHGFILPDNVLGDCLYLSLPEIKKCLEILILIMGGGINFYLFIFHILFIFEANIVLILTMNYFHHALKTENTKLNIIQ